MISKDIVVEAAQLAGLCKEDGELLYQEVAQAIDAMAPLLCCEQEDGQMPLVQAEWREDRVGESLPRQTVLSAAKQHGESTFCVFRTVAE